MSVKIHMLRMMKMETVLPGRGGNRNLMCICRRAKRLRVRWGDAGFIISYNVGPSEPLRVAISLHVLQLCKDQEDLFLLAACPSLETEKPRKKKGTSGLCCGL